MRTMIAPTESAQSPRNGTNGPVNTWLLRGRVVPVVDLSVKLGLPELEYNQRPCIIVAKIETRLEN